jgi:heptosyltransferase-1
MIAPARPPEGIRRIAIVRLSAFGDVVMALPALEGLRAAFPGAHIAWIVEERARGLLEGHPAIDELIDFPKARWKTALRKGGEPRRALAEMRAFWRNLRGQGFDLAVDFQGNLKSGLVTWATGARIRLGYAQEECREPNTLFTTLRVSLGGQAIHRMDRDLLLVGAVGVPFAHRPVRIAFTDPELAAAREVLAAPPGLRTVVLHPGTSAFMPHKRWPPTSYARLARGLQARGGVRVLLSWGPGDEDLLEEIQAAAPGATEPLPLLPGPRALGAVLRGADLVVGSDTGPVHLASLLGAPTIALLGPGDPRHYYPHGHPERAFYRRVACSPCRLRSCPTRDCMAGIRPDEVLARAFSILG